MRINDPQVVKQIIQQSRTIAVVGLSSKPTRPSFGVARYLQSEGYRIIPVNPNETTVLGEHAYSRLGDITEPIDVVEIFRRSEFVAQIIDDAIQIGAKAVWMQEGVVDEAAARRAAAAGLLVVMNKCMLKEHRKLTRQSGG